MIDKKEKRSSRKKTFIAHSSSWLRAPRSGINIPRIKLGSMVKKGDLISEIANPFGDHKTPIRAHESGMLMGMSLLPLANKGDALFHIACEKEKKLLANVSITDYFDNIDPINAH